jgi:hypothetical protein
MPKLIREGNPLPRFKEFLKEEERNRAFSYSMLLFEHERYKRMPGTQQSYREDPGNTNTMTLRHSHVFAHQKGRGRELYAVNIDGSGHDGSSGTAIPTAHADFFRSKGYQIPDTNILESLEWDALDPDQFTLLVLEG